MISNRLKLMVIVSFFFLSMPALASIGIEIKADQECYARYEHINISLVLRNNTGNRLDFGEMSEEGQRGTLHFNIQDGRGNKVQQRKDPTELISNLVLRAGETKEITFPLNNFYNLSRETTYTVHAQIAHDRLRHAYRTSGLRFEVREPHIIWRQNFGVPTEEDKEIEHRTASIRRLSYGRKEIYCFQIEDENYVYVVNRIGRHISGANPQGLVDGHGNVHVFLRIKSRIFRYQAYNYRGDLIRERYYTFANESRPALRRDSETGAVRVGGGRRAERGQDYVLPDDTGEEAPRVGAPVLDPL